MPQPGDALAPDPTPSNPGSAVSPKDVEWETTPEAAPHGQPQGAAASAVGSGKSDNHPQAAQQDCSDPQEDRQKVPGEQPQGVDFQKIVDLLRPMSPAGSEDELRQHAEAAGFIAKLCHNALAGQVEAGHHREMLLAAGAVPALCGLLLQDKKGEKVTEQAARALGNLTCDSPANCTEVVREQALPKLATLLLAAPLKTKECAAATLHNVAFTGGENREAVAATKGVVRGLAVLLGEGAYDTFCS